MAHMFLGQPALDEFGLSRVPDVLWPVVLEQQGRVREKSFEVLEL